MRRRDKGLRHPDSEKLAWTTPGGITTKLLRTLGRPALGRNRLIISTRKSKGHLRSSFLIQAGQRGSKEHQKQARHPANRDLGFGAARTSRSARCRRREEKLAILAEARDAPTSVSAVARRHGLHPSLLFRWRRDACDVPVRQQPAFIPFALPVPTCPSPQERAAAGVIEIDLAGGHRVRAEAGVEVAVLRSVIEALVER